MEIDTQRVIELVKSVRPLFMDHERASRITVKGAADFVTQVDFQVQERMRSGLFDMYPQVQFMGEEKDNRDIDFSGAVWILDPVDGTTNRFMISGAAPFLWLCVTGDSWSWESYISPIGMSCFWHGGAGERFSTEAPSMSALSVIWDRA